MRPTSLSTVMKSTALLLAATLLFGCARPAAPPEPAAKASAPEASAPEAAPQGQGETDLDPSNYKERAAAAGDDALEADKQREQALKDAGG